MQLKPGTRLQSVTCDTQVIAVRVPAADLDLRCGGRPMVPIGDDAERSEPQPGFDGGTLMGKRYGSEESGVELLCTKPGTGALSLGDELIGLKESKPLPSSD